MRIIGLSDTHNKHDQITEPDAQEMAELRNYIEHRFVRVVAAYGASGRGAQGLLYTVTRDDFERRALTILRLARVALIMLVSAVYVEERRRGPGRGAWTVLPGLKIPPEGTLSQIRR